MLVFSYSPRSAAVKENIKAKFIFFLHMTMFELSAMQIFNLKFKIHNVLFLSTVICKAKIKFEMIQRQKDIIKKLFKLSQLS